MSSASASESSTCSAASASSAASSSLLSSSSALIIVDVQQDFCSGGALAVPQAEQVLPVINELRALGCWRQVFLTADCHPPNHASFAANNPGTQLFSTVTLPGIGEQVMWPVHCVQDSAGAAFHEALQREPADVIVRKGRLPSVDSYSGFGSPGGKLERTALEEELRSRGITDIVVCGLALDYCVSFTAKDGARLGFNAWLVLDGTRGIAADSMEKELAAMREAGVHIVQSVQDLPACLIGSR